MRIPLPVAHQQLIKVLKDERSKLQDLVWELDDIEHSISVLEERMSFTPDLGSAHELERLRQRQDRLEDAVLHQMMYIDRLEERLDQLPYSTVRSA
ncbi:MAG: hypothetical protein KAX40_00795 [Herpetosiphon sp.]|nr:hypothetical protein [Herpetosiphon sp.]